MWSFVHLIDGPSGMDIVMVYFPIDAVQMITLFYNNHICLLKLQRHAILLLQVLLGLDQSLGGLRGQQ